LVQGETVAALVAEQRPEHGTTSLARGRPSPSAVHSTVSIADAADRAVEDTSRALELDGAAEKLLFDVIRLFEPDFRAVPGKSPVEAFGDMAKFGEEARLTFIALRTLRAVQGGHCDAELVSFSATLHDFRSVLESLVNRLLVTPFSRDTAVTETDKGGFAVALRERRTVGSGTVLGMLKSGKVRGNPLERAFVDWVSRNPARAALRSEMAREHMDALLSVHLHGINHHPERARQEWPTILAAVERHLYGSLSPNGDGLVQLLRGLPT
jgi:hypothetical protein